MLRRTAPSSARYQPFAMAFQSRFKWRHRESDPWRRLMDATCFTVDWITRPRGPDFSQFSGHWTHVVSCAHVMSPWMYPNYYPPVGMTRFVSKITLADTMSQARMPSLQGEVIYRHFLSNFHTFIHSNPRLDLAVAHPEQNFKRGGEMKLLWLQNEGFVKRPRFEVIEDLRVGDHVWIHGMSARSNVFDEEAVGDPLMIPTGVRARVKHLAKENFYLEPIDELQPEIAMGMCGAPVVRDGKLVGMLTATVHESSENAFLRNTAMCTYGHEIRSFLMEVEKQMKNPAAYQEKDKSTFQERREEEGHETPQYKDWDRIDGRVAHHVKVPVSLWKMDTDWMQEEDRLSSGIYGRSGPFSAEVQEQMFGMEMNTVSHDGRKPEGVNMTSADGGAMVDEGMRPDPSPSNIHGPPEAFKTKSVWDSTAGEEVKASTGDAVKEGDTAILDKLRRSVEGINSKRMQQQMMQTAVDGGLTKARAKDLAEENRRKEQELRQRKRPMGLGGDEDLAGLWDETLRP